MKPRRVASKPGSIKITIPIKRGNGHGLGSSSNARIINLPSIIAGEKPAAYSNLEPARRRQRSDWVGKAASNQLDAAERLTKLQDIEKSLAKLKRPAEIMPIINRLLVTATDAMAPSLVRMRASEIINKTITEGKAKLPPSLFEQFKKNKKQLKKGTY